MVHWIFGRVLFSMNARGTNSLADATVPSVISVVCRIIMIGPCRDSPGFVESEIHGSISSDLRSFSSKLQNGGPVKKT